jgi:hypothetical protein
MLGDDDAVGVELLENGKALLLELRDWDLTPSPKFPLRGSSK